MDNVKSGVAVYVKSKIKSNEKGGWRDGWLFGGHFESLAASVNYLQFLEKRETEFQVQIGFVGWGG